MQIYFHSRLCSYLSRVPILVEGTVYIYFIIIIFTYVHHAIIEHAIVMYQMKTVHSLEYFYLFIFQFLRIHPLNSITFNFPLP